MSEGPVFISDILPEHVRFVRAVARSLLDDDEAEDAVQDTLLRALEQPPEPGNIRGWLRVVVRNFALRRKREEKRRKRREMLQGPPDRISTPAESLARIEGQQRVLEAVRHLPEPYRSMIVHHYLDELTRDQIAERLGIPVETVRTRLKRALRILRERLDRDNSAHGWIGALLPLLALPRPRPRAAGPTALALLAAKIVVGAAVLGCGTLLLAGRGGSDGPPRASAELPASAPATLATTTASEGPAGAPEAADPLLVSCVVRDASGVPLAGAHAVASGCADDTGPDGIFRLPASATDGRLRVTVKKPGYLPWRGALDALPGVEQSITLLRGVVLSVVVRTTDGSPVPGAAVRASAREDRGVAGLWWARRLSSVAECVSGPDGCASLGAAPEGKIEVRVDDPRYASWSEEIVLLGTNPVLVEAVLSGGGQVSGRITDGAGNPVAGARVYAAAWPARPVLSREDGSYDLRLVEPGERRILAEADGFGIGYFGAEIGWGKPVPVRVAAGRTTPDVDIVLPASIAVRGRVVDGNGRPLPDVRVDARIGPCSGRPVAAKTDELGMFSIGPFAETDGHPIRLALALDGYAFDPVVVEPGPGGLDLGDLLARRLWGVRGRVLDVDGRPLSAGRVEILPRGPASLVAADGTFVVRNVPSGRARIRASAWGPARSAAVAVDVGPGGGADGVEIRLGPALPIRGHVLSRSGRPRAGVPVGAIAEGDEEPVAQATTDASGAFELKALPQGAYLVGILRTPFEEETAAPNSVVDFTDDAVAVRLVVPGYESEAAASQPVLVADPKPEPAVAGTEDLTLVLSRRGTVVDGTVVSGATGLPLASFEVSFIEYWHGIIPRGSESVDFRDDAGRFEYELGEGDWAVEISAPGHASYRTPVFRSGAHATSRLGTIRLGAGGRISGAIRDAAGDPVSYARLYLLGPQMQTNRHPIFTDAEGTFDGSCLAPGAYTVFVLSPRHPFGIVRNVRIAEGEMSPLDVRLDRPSPVTLLVKDDAGQPVAGADVSYTCDALLPLTSRLLRSHEPPGWGGYLTDAEGRLCKAYLPAGRVMFSVRAPGFAKARRVVELKEDCETLVEIRLERQG